MPKFEIRYALGGGFGGTDNKEWEEIEAKDESDANDQAYQLAIEEYEGMVGMHGLRTEEEIMEEDDVDEDESKLVYDEEMDGWLDYEARPSKHDAISESSEVEA